jgi:hypothetical protein
MLVDRFVRLTGLSCIVGALILVPADIHQAISALEPGDPGFALGNAFGITGHLMLLVGVLGLARSRAAGAGLLAGTGLCTAGLGWVLLVAGEIAFGAGSPLGEPLLTAAGPVTGIGMVLAGTAVLRARQWRSWTRFTPLACGLYIFVVLLPGFAIFGLPNYWVVAGWSLCWLALGVALRAETVDRTPVPQPIA